MAEFLKTPKSVILPTLENIEDPKVKKVLEEYNRAFNELVTAVYSDLSWLYGRLTVEEGTWTPDLQFGGLKVGITYTTQSGTYTKIVNQVFGFFDIVLTSKGSSTGLATIEGLPFVALKGGNCIIIYHLNITVFWECRIDGAGTKILLYQNNAGNLADINNADFANSTRIVGTINYSL